MNETFAIAIAFLVMLNPFAMFVFLEPLRRNMEGLLFKKMLLKATLNSAAIFVFFYLAGDFLFSSVLRIHFDAFRIFGGIIIFSFAYIFIIRGRKTLIQEKQNINDLAMDVSIPFMVGAGTVSLSILLGQTSPHPVLGTLLIFLILTINYLLILGLGYTRLLFIRRPDYFDRCMDTIMRINIFLIGAIGVDMAMTGLSNLLG